MNEYSNGNSNWKWLLATVAVIGFGIWAWETLGPDLRRYMKIENM